MIFTNEVFRDVYTYRVLFEIAESSYREGIQEKYGSFQNLLISMLFCAFTIEGFFNHLGCIYNHNWAHEEKPRSRKEIQDCVFSYLEYQVNKNKKPFCYLNTIFDFRDDIVHANTIHFKIKNAKMDKNNENPLLPMTKWEKMIRKETGKKFLDNTKEMIQILYRKAGFSEDPFGPPWTSSWVIDRSKVPRKD